TLWWECENGLLTPAESVSIQVPTAAIMTAINSWPAHGNISEGQDYWLAPFFDRNADGNYDPADGDYPVIKGCCASYMIQNDRMGTHTPSASFPIGLEIHYMFYHYRTWDYLNNATFVEVAIRNTSVYDYTDFIYGIRVEPSIGTFNDNRFGCDSTTNMMYF
ncbi:MAG: hypothetical protein HRT57_10975, partial [Crocinitomicaceae bacterium]|nr:hypothetical protein [Crocinitomicaceae bacterium]